MKREWNAPHVIRDFQVTHGMHMDVGQDAAFHDAL